MTDLFNLAMPWWEYVLRACVVYFVLLAMIRVAGKRSMGQFTLFDMLLVVLLGNAVQNALLGRDVSLLGGVLLAATLVTLNWLVGFIISRSTRAEHLLEGVPVLLARDGKVYHAALKRQNISQGDFDEAMREADCDQVEDIHLALLETNGKISIVRREGNK